MQKLYCVQQRFALLNAFHTYGKASDLQNYIVFNKVRSAKRIPYAQQDAVLKGIMIGCAAYENSET